jgi:hypothetical protein
MVSYSVFTVGPSDAQASHSYTTAPAEVSLCEFEEGLNREAGWEQSQDHSS